MQFYRRVARFWAVVVRRPKIPYRGTSAQAGVVGDTVVQRPGTYDNSKFVGWSEQDETGQSYRADHAFVNYQIPVRPHDTSLIFVHGFGGDGVVWQWRVNLPIALTVTVETRRRLNCLK